MIPSLSGLPLSAFLAAGLNGGSGAGNWEIAGQALAWYLALLLIAAVGLAPAAMLLPGLASRGMHLARPFGLALASLVTWLIVHLTPLPYGTPTVLLSLVLVGTGGAAAVLTRPTARDTLLGGLRSGWREFAAIEAGALVVFVVVLLMRIQTPDAWGTEKPADLMMLTAVHRATDLPPLDPWAAGETISYYHLGQLQMDHVARLAGVGPAEAFNLATATAGAMAVAAVMGLAMDIVRLDAAGPARRVRRRLLAIAAGVSGAGLLLVAPLIGLVQVLAANGVGERGMWERLAIEGVPPAGGATSFVPDAFWWWWPTTRVVSDVISEYPAFSLLLGDPHPHLLALSLGVVALALAVQVFAGGAPLTWRRWLARPESLVLTSALFASLAMTNSWDVLSYGGIWAAAAWWAASRAGWPAHTAALVAARWAILPTVGGALLAYPFLQSLDPAPIGIALVRGESSDSMRWLLFWCPLLLLLGSGIWLLAADPSRPAFGWRWVAAFAVLPVAWLVAIVASGDAREAVERQWWVALLLPVWAGGAAHRAWASHERRAVEAALWLVACWSVLLLLTELVHIDDQFPGRLNTTFKYWFHAWVIAAVAGGSLVALSVDRWLGSSWVADRRAQPDQPRLRWYDVTWVALVLVVCVASLVTVPAMAISRTREPQELALSATAYLDRTDDGLAAAVAWGLAELDPGRHVVLEAVGESYRDGSRFSAFTGVPTVLGWAGHERQWRSDLREAERRAAMEAIYTGDEAARLAAVHAWGVTHVLVGPQERAAFGSALTIEEAGWPVAFEAGLMRVFAAPASAISATAP